MKRSEAAENRVRKKRRSGRIAVVEHRLEKIESGTMCVPIMDNICYFSCPINQSPQDYTNDERLTQSSALSFASIYPSNRMPRLIKQLPLGSPHAHPR